MRVLKIKMQYFGRDLDRFIDFESSLQADIDKPSRLRLLRWRHYTMLSLMLQNTFKSCNSNDLCNSKLLTDGAATEHLILFA